MSRKDHFFHSKTLSTYNVRLEAGLDIGNTQTENKKSLLSKSLGVRKILGETYLRSEHQEM